MIHAVLNRKGKKIIQVRSQAGKLLFVKTKTGYELKCPRSKKIYTIPYETMIAEYLTPWNDQVKLHEYQSPEAGDRESSALHVNPQTKGGLNDVISAELKSVNPNSRSQLKENDNA